MTAWPDGIPARTGSVCRRDGADRRLWPLLAAAELGTGNLVVGQADSAGQTGVWGSGGDPVVDVPRDKLAQLLMVGVRGGDDAQAVVATNHVGGIFIGSWTDLSMLTNGMVKNLSRQHGTAGGGQRR